MKRMLYLLLLAIVLVGCPTPSSEPTPTPHTPVTPVTPSEPEPVEPPTPMVVDYRTEWTTSHTDNTHTFSVTVKAVYDDSSERVLDPSEYELSDWYYEHSQTDTDYEVTDTATVTVGTWSDSHSETMTVVSVYTEYVSKELVVNYDVPNQVGDIYYSFEYTVKTTNNKNDEVRTTTYTTIEELDAAGIEHNLVAHEWYLPYSPDEVEYSRSFTIDGVSKEINITMPMPRYGITFDSIFVSVTGKEGHNWEYCDWTISLTASVNIDVIEYINGIITHSSLRPYDSIVLDKMPDGYSIENTIVHDERSTTYGTFRTYYNELPEALGPNQYHHFEITIKRNGTNNIGTRKFHCKTFSNIIYNGFTGYDVHSGH